MHVLNSRLIRCVDSYTDQHHETFAVLGQELFNRFGSNNGKVSTQVRNLQQIALSATRFADIEDFVKNQMGKGNNEAWKAVGPSVLGALARLRKASQEIADDSNDQFAVRLRLAWGWARAVVGEYLYRLALEQMGEHS